MSRVLNTELQAGSVHDPEPLEAGRVLWIRIAVLGFALTFFLEHLLLQLVRWQVRPAVSVPS